MPRISIVVPVHNEEGNLRPLLEGIARSLQGIDYEVLVVNDGSTDRSREEILALDDPRIRRIDLPMRQGQSRALYEGFREARGRILVKLDADLQNDPADIPALIRTIEEGYDAALGVRRKREDPLHRRIQSRIANGFANLVLGERFRDRGCGLQAFRSEAVAGLEYWDGMHRFFPTLLKGRRMIEVEVSHRPRRHGRSKYGWFSRAVRAFRDLLRIAWRCREGW